MNYLLTFRTYGTWLHGDERGSVDSCHNQHESPLLAASATREKDAKRIMKFPALLLDDKQRTNIEQTINEVVTFRHWHLHAASVQSNHVHLVVSVSDDISPERVMNDFKTRATFRLREAKLIDPERKIWERHGSTKYLFTEKELSAACDYVLNRQNETKKKEPRA